MAASVVESAYLIQMGGDASSLSLSRQQFLSCSRLAESPYWGGRCAGGDVGEVSGRWVRVCGADSPCYWGGRCAGGDVGEVSGQWVGSCGGGWRLLL